METYNEAIEAAKTKVMKAHIKVIPGLYIEWECVEMNSPWPPEKQLSFNGVEPIGSEDMDILMTAWGSVMVSIAELKVNEVSIEYE